jgi:hypothetical protein
MIRQKEILFDKVQRTVQRILYSRQANLTKTNFFLWVLKLESEACDVTLETRNICRHRNQKHICPAACGRLGKSVTLHASI